MAVGMVEIDRDRRRGARSHRYRLKFGISPCAEHVFVGRSGRGAVSAVLATADGNRFRPQPLFVCGLVRPEVLPDSAGWHGRFAGSAASRTGLLAIPSAGRTVGIAPAHQPFSSRTMRSHAWGTAGGSCLFSTDRCCGSAFHGDEPYGIVIVFAVGPDSSVADHQCSTGAVLSGVGG